MGFRLEPKSMTLNDLEQRNGRYFVLLTSSDERFAFLVARHCAVHCSVYIHFILLHSWLNKLID